MSFQTLKCINLSLTEEVLFCKTNNVREQFCGVVYNRVTRDGRGEMLLRWLQRGGVFGCLRKSHLRPLVSRGSNHLEVQQERFPALEDLSVSFVMDNSSYDWRMNVDLPTLRKLSVHCPSKNRGDLFSLHAQRKVFSLQS